MNLDDQVNTLLSYLRKSNPTLFAGAGVSARVGYPTWGAFLKYLAETLRPYSTLTSDLISHYVAADNYLYAAHLYKSNPDMPVGDKFKALATPFRERKDPAAVHPLVSLGFTRIVTTNYERSLHQAYAAVYSKDALSIELGDSLMKQGPFIDEFHIARIHGRAEAPETIVIDGEDYQRTERDPYYKDFLSHVLTNCTCIFVGYSFVDPAIRRVLEVIQERLGPNFPKLHLALIPQGRESEKLKLELAKSNISTLEYSPDNGHANLWKIIETAAKNSREYPVKTRKPDHSSQFISNTKHFLSTCVVRKRIGSKLEPLRDTVLDGIVLTTISDLGPSRAEFSTVVGRIREVFRVTETEANALAARSIQRMTDRSWISLKDGILLLGQLQPESYGEQVGRLAKAAFQRMEVRFATPVVEDVARNGREIVEECIARAATHLCSNYSGRSGVGTGNDIWETVQSATKRCKSLDPEMARKLSWSIWDLFRAPTNAEAEIISELSRVAFGVELALNSANLTLLTDLPLPNRIYLDANVLMPAIVEGHPLRPLYVNAFRRLSDSLQLAGKNLELCVADEFLNEIISHRELALELVKVSQFEDREKLARAVLLYGAQNVNVFVGGYATYIAGTRSPQAFPVFLDRVAPYRTVPELAEYLKRQNIQTASLQFSINDELVVYENVRHDLQSAYEIESASKARPKPPLLIEHEARQIARLACDLNTGRQSLFVTADERLRRHTGTASPGVAANAVISNLAFVQLVDLLLGVSEASSSFVRAMWMVKAPNEMSQIRNYLTDLALREQDDALIVPMNEILDRYAQKVADDAQRENVSLFPGNVAEHERTQRFLDRVEDEFFEEMQKLIRKKGS